MPYRIAGIDMHKKMLVVVVADVEVEGAREPCRPRCAGSRCAHVREVRCLDQGVFKNCPCMPTICIYPCGDTLSTTTALLIALPSGPKAIWPLAP